MKDAILQRVAAGDRSAVDECLTRYGGLVWSIARRFFVERCDTEDAVQEVFIELWRMAARFDPSAGSEIAFVTMVARRRLIDRLRKNQRRVSTTPLTDDLTAVTPRKVDRLELCEEAARAAAELAQLRPEERRVLELSIHQGLAHDQIAAAIGVPLGTVKTHIRRGLIRLREKLLPGPTQTVGGGTQ